jgi:hypothetical protein
VRSVAVFSRQVKSCPKMGSFPERFSIYPPCQITGMLPAYWRNPSPGEPPNHLSCLAKTFASWGFRKALRLHKVKETENAVYARMASVPG